MRVGVKERAKKHSSHQPFARHSGSIAFWRGKKRNPSWRRDGEGGGGQRRRRPEVLHTRWLLCPLPLTLVSGFSSFAAHLAAGSPLITIHSVTASRVNSQSHFMFGLKHPQYLETVAGVNFLCLAAHMESVSSTELNQWTSFSSLYALQASFLLLSSECSHSSVMPFIKTHPLNVAFRQSKSYSVHMTFSLEGLQGSSSLTHFFPKAKDLGKQRGGMLGGGVGGWERDKDENEREGRSIR